MPTFGTTFLLGQNTGIQFEIMRKCHYRVQIQGIDASELACQDTVVPRYELEQAEFYYYNDRIKAAMKPNPSELTIDIVDYVQPAIVDQLWTWFNQVYNVTTRNTGYASDYKRQAKILMRDPNGKDVRTWTAGGLWPMNTPVQGEALSYEAGQDFVKIDMKFSCDYVTLDAASAN